MFRYFSLIALFCIGAAAVSCVLPDGTEVPWFIAIKAATPAKADTPIDAEHAAGRALFYIAENMVAFERAAHGVDEAGMIGQSLAGLYDGSARALWNDQPVVGSVPSDFAHMKGAFIFDHKDDSALWLVHSVPHFPHPDHYLYGDKQTKFGQSFFCMSGPADDFDAAMASVIHTARPYVSDFDTNGAFEQAMPQLAAQLAGNGYERSAAFNHVPLPTLSQLDEVTAHYKSARFGRRAIARGSHLFFWERLADHMDEGGKFYTETWTNGKGTKMPIYCPADSADVDHAQLSAAVVNNEVLEIAAGVHWKRTADHSKWGISSRRARLVCLGGVNHMESQAKRGGGAVCVRSTSVWEAFHRIIRSTEGDCK